MNRKELVELMASGKEHPLDDKHPMVDRWVVMRSHSLTDNQYLLKVMSRPLKDEQTANHEREFYEFMESKKKKRRKQLYTFFVMKVVNAGVQI